MFQRRWQLASLGLVTALSLSLSACTDDPAIQTKNNDNNIKENPNVDPPANAKLEHVAPSCEPAEKVCIARLTFSSKRLLQARLLDKDGAPVRNTTVKFAVKQTDAEEARLEAASAITNDEGIAETNLNAGAEGGSVTIIAETNDPNVPPIEYIITVNSKDASDYLVDFVEVGAINAKDIKVAFYSSDISCDDFYSATAAERNNLPVPPNFTAQTIVPAQVEPDGRLPLVSLGNVPNGTSYTVAAKAYSETNGAVEVAIGCKDNNPAVMSGAPVRVTVPLVKNLPTLVGEYQIVQRFDLRDGLPDNVRLVVDLLGTAISDPGAFIVGCDMGDMGCAIPTAGLVNIIIDVLPNGDFKDAIQSFLDSNFTKAVVRNVINDVFNDFITNNSSVPSWVKDSVTITQDIYKTLQSFEVTGTLRIKKQPQYTLDAEGLPTLDGQGRTQAIWTFANDDEKNEHIWSKIAFFWRQGCDANSPPSCGRREIDQNLIGGSGTFIKGTWDGAVFDGSMLQVNEHSLTLNYGALLLAVVEKIVLPAIFGTNSMGQPVDSIERLFGMIINCESVADSVANSTTSSVRGIVKNLCDQLLVQASDGIRTYATEKLVADGANTFIISTPVGKDCTMLPPEVYASPWPGEPLPYVQQLGQKEPVTKQCEWDVKIKFSENNTKTMGGLFYGDRN